MHNTPVWTFTSIILSSKSDTWNNSKKRKQRLKPVRKITNPKTDKQKQLLKRCRIEKLYYNRTLFCLKGFFRCSFTCKKIKTSKIWAYWPVYSFPGDNSNNAKRIRPGTTNCKRIRLSRLFPTDTTSHNDVFQQPHYLPELLETLHQMPHLQVSYNRVDSKTRLFPGLFPGHQRLLLERLPLSGSIRWSVFLAVSRVAPIQQLPPIRGFMSIFVPISPYGVRWGMPMSAYGKVT